MTTIMFLCLNLHYSVREQLYFYQMFKLFLRIKTSYKNFTFYISYKKSSTEQVTVKNKINIYVNVFKNSQILFDVLFDFRILILTCKA